MSTDKITTIAGLVAAIAGGVAAANIQDPTLVKWAGLIGSIALAVKGYYTNKP